MYIEDFLIRHRQLAESADNVLFIHTPTENALRLNRERIAERLGESE